MTTPNSIKPFSDWKLLFGGLLSVATMLIVLCATSCSTSKKVEQSVVTQHTAVAAREDSLQSAVTHRQTTLLTHQTVKADSLSMAIPLTSLRELPPGASYAQRKGRAHVSLRSRGDTLYIDAGCDSLQRLVEFYSTAYNAERARSRKMDSIADRAILLAEKQEKQYKPPALLDFLLVPLLVVGGAALLYHFRNRIKSLFL